MSHCHDTKSGDGTKPKIILCNVQCRLRDGAVWAIWPSVGALEVNFIG